MIYICALHSQITLELLSSFLVLDHVAESQAMNEWKFILKLGMRKRKPWRDLYVYLNFYFESYCFQKNILPKQASFVEM